jgi:hypothetical protein
MITIRAVPALLSAHHPRAALSSVTLRKGFADPWEGRCSGCYSGTITVCAVPCNSILLHDGGRCGTVSGPLSLSYIPTVVNCPDCPEKTLAWGRKKPNRWAPASVVVSKGTETSIPSAVSSVAISEDLKLTAPETPVL